jgi:hypothetical protein
MAQIRFAFGKTGIQVPIPEGTNYQIIEARSAAAIHGVAASLEYALDHPVGTEPLHVLATGKQSAAISVCDITRPTHRIGSLFLLCCNGCIPPVFL